MQDTIEIVISDNASTDSTEQVVNKYKSISNNINYIRNNENLGYVGNQISCFKNATGKYIAILCDDDIYTNGTIHAILNVINKKEYSFIALNYYSFYENPEKPIGGAFFAPNKNVEFSRAYDVHNYPSVGHFSGYVFNSSLAKTALQASLGRQTIDYYEKGRGILFDVAARATLGSDLSSYFIGTRFLAARAPMDVDYDSLFHLCIDYN